MEKDCNYTIDDYIFDYLGNMTEEELDDYFEKVDD